jgi:hypothetical protein
MALVAPLLTLRTLAVWTQKDPTEVQRDPLASEVIQTVSDMARFLGGHDGTKLDSSGDAIPMWTLEPGVNKVPYDVQMVVLQVCKRTYGNPEQIVQEGNIGPIGGDRVLDAAALLLDLTDAERSTLTKYNQDGDPDGEGGELFTITTSRGTATIAKSAVLYVGDDQQVGLLNSVDPREWKIPLFNPNDPGDPNLYPDEEA